MKKFFNLHLFLVLGAIAALPAFAEEVKKDSYDKIESSGDFAKLMTQQPIVADAYNICKKSNVPIEQVPDCIFGKLQTTEQGKEIIAKLQKKNKETPLAEMPSSVRIKNENPAIQKLREYLDKKLAEYLYGDVAKSDPTQTGNKVLDQVSFFKLYKSQVSKDIITAITSYCMEADSNHKITSECEKPESPNCADYRQKKIKDLENMRSNAQVFKQWSRCLGSIAGICYDSNTPSSDNSKMRACEVTNFIRGLRQSLIQSEKQQKALEELGDRQKNTSRVLGNNIEVVDTTQVGGEKRVEDVTVFTSKDAQEYKSAMDKDKLIQKCQAMQGQNDLPSECANLGISKEEQVKSEENAIGAALKQRALEEEITTNNDALKAQLEAEGRTKEEIDKIMSNPTDIATIQTDLKKQYQAEREALLKSLSGQLSQKQTQGKGATSTTDQVIQELQSKPKRLEQIVHFDNIVSGYLSIQSGGKQIGTNAATMLTELKSNTQMDKDTKAELTKTAEEELKKSSSKEGEVSLDIKQINETILKAPTPAPVTTP